MRKLLLITLSVLSYSMSIAQIITTVAGGVGDGWPAINSNLKNPTNTAVDGSGNIYIADCYYNRIRKVTASTGVITTVAGNGTPAFGGDGNAAILANLNNPNGLVLDSLGNIYIADANNHRIRKVTASTGVISTVAGNGTAGYGGDGSVATLANLNYPRGVAVDGSGNIYIADEYNHRIRKVSVSNGIISTIAGNGIAAFGGDDSAATSAKLYNPNEVAIDVSGNIYIADCYNQRIRKVTVSNGIISTVAGNGIGGFGGDGSTAISANLSNPSGVKVDGTGNIYIADNNNNRIRKVTTSTGVITTVAGNGINNFGGDGSIATSANLYYPHGLSVDGSGNIYLADAGNNRIRKITASTGIINTVAGNGAGGGYLGDGGAASSSMLFYPRGVAADGLGNIYIADYGNNRIRKITATTGVISTVAGNGTGGYGGDGGAATSANLNSPMGVAIDGLGNIYIADNNNHRIRKVTASTGIISTIAGNGAYGYSGDGSAATLAKLYNPQGVALDGSGNIYIADLYNHRIRKITASTGVISTVAGNGTPSFGGDGNIATFANLNYPQGLTIDGSGNIYIADFYNHRIRKVTASTGLISTVAGNGTNGYGVNGIAATSANLNGPSGVTVDGSGNIYIADYNNHEIRKVTASTGIISIVAGSGTSSDGGDGGIATSANLNYPRGVALDGSGNIYIADNYNNRIRKVNYSIDNNYISNSQIICAGLAPSSLMGSTPIGASGSYTYSWLSSTISASAGFTTIPSSNTINYSPGALTQNKWYRRVVVSGNYNDTSAAVDIMVNNAIANNTITSTTQTICSGNTPTPITATTATGGNGTTYTYKWLKSTTSATAGFTNAGGNDSITNFNSNVLTQNTWFRRRVSSGVCNADTTVATLITVNNAITNNTITGAPQTICSGSIPATIAATIATGGNGTTYKYKWLKSTTSATAGFANAGGNDSTQNFTSGALTQNTWFKRRVSSGVCNADTTAALLVTIKPTSTSTSIISICPSALPYTWNGRTYNSNRTDTVILKNAASCDSITILNLIVKPTSSSTNNISICPSSLPYTWNGLIFNSTGTQTKTGLTNSVECDSSATLNLTVNPIPSTSNITGLTNVARLDTASYSVTGISGSVFNWVTTKGLVQTGTNTNQIQVKWNAIGMDTLKVTETSNQGCVGTQKTLLVNIRPATGMNEINTSSSILVYPNPFNETIFISLLNNSGLNKAILFDLLGKEVLTTHKSEIDVKELKSGVYLIMVIDDNGNSYSQKLIKN